MKRVLGVVVFVLCACQAEPQSPSVSGESHFLSVCDESAECAAALECICGLCTVVCEGDQACAVAESGTRCVDPATCAGASRICTRACAGDADCEGAGLTCLEGACVAESGEGASCAAGGCPVGRLEHNGRCGANCPSLADLSRGCIGSHTEQECLFCGDAYIRVGGDDAVTLFYRPSGELAAVAERAADGVCDEVWRGLDLSTCVDRGEQRRVLCEDQGEPPPVGQPLASLTLTPLWADCPADVQLPDVPSLLGQCWTKLGVRAPASLVLEDSLGALEFDLTFEEFATVERLTWDPAFQSILDHPELCEGGIDVSSSLTFQWERQDPVEIPDFGGCVPVESVRAMDNALRALLHAHLTCPAPTPPGIVPLPVRALCFGCDDCRHNDCQGVIVPRDPETYCVGPDSSRFTCPESRPVRGKLYGAAICGAEPGVPDEATARSVAREALQTALIQSQARIERLKVPAEATHWPGVAGGSRIEGTAVVFDPGTSWFSGDEGPISCGESFDHLEIEPAGEGLGFFVSAWNSVVECGQPQAALAQEVPTPATFTLPEPAGVYPVVLRQPGGSTAGPTLLVEQNAACPPESPLLEACFTGLLFAECGGALPPAIFCTVEDRPCAWFAGGCPAADYSRPVECDPTDTMCPEPGIGWGPEPWNREREMVLPLTIDPLFEAPVEPVVTCACDTPPCLGETRGFCNDALAERYLHRTLEVAEPATPQNGLVVAILFADGPELGLTNDRAWVLEADLEFAHARVCLFQTSDAGNAGPPSCALSGEVTFDREVRTRGDGAAVHGRALATFEHLPGNPSETIVIDARF